MIFYLYLSILIVVSIITGIIVTILEKRGLRAQQTPAKVSSIPDSKVISQTVEVTPENPISVIAPHSDVQMQLTVVIEPIVEEEEPVLLSSVTIEEPFDYDTPYIISTVDQDAM